MLIVDYIVAPAKVRAVGALIAWHHRLSLLPAQAVLNGLDKVGATPEASMERAALARK